MTAEIKSHVAGGPAWASAHLANRGARAAILAVGLLLCGPPVFSQGCSMCYSTAKATSTDGQRAIRKGVLVLLIPPLSFMTLGVWFAFRYGKKRDTEQDPALPPTLPIS